MNAAERVCPEEAGHAVCTARAAPGSGRCWLISPDCIAHKLTAFVLSLGVLHGSDHKAMTPQSLGSIPGMPYVEAADVILTPNRYSSCFSPLLDSFSSRDCEPAGLARRILGDKFSLTQTSPPRGDGEKPKLNHRLTRSYCTYFTLQACKLCIGRGSKEVASVTSSDFPTEDTKLAQHSSPHNKPKILHQLCSCEAGHYLPARILH